MESLVLLGQVDGWGPGGSIVYIFTYEGRGSWGRLDGYGKERDSETVRERYLKKPRERMERMREIEREKHI